MGPTAHRYAAIRPFLYEDEMDRFRAGSSGSLAPSLIPYNSLTTPMDYDNGEKAPPAEKEVVVDLGEDESFEEEFEEMKQRVAMAESAAEDYKLKNVALQAKVDELNAKLETSQDQQRKFMAAGDKSLASLENLNEDAADKVIKALSAKLGSLAALGASVGNVVTRLTAMDKTLSDIPKLLGEQIGPLSNQSGDLVSKMDSIFSRMETSHESLSSGIMVTNNTLNHFGFADDETAVNVPVCLQTLLTASPKIGPQICYYLSQQIVATFVCKCGCGIEVQLDQSQDTSGNACAGGNGSDLGGQVFGQDANSGTVPALGHSSSNPGLQRSMALGSQQVFSASQSQPFHLQGFSQPPVYQPQPNPQVPQQFLQPPPQDFQQMPPMLQHSSVVASGNNTGQVLTSVARSGPYKWTTPHGQGHQVNGVPPIQQKLTRKQRKTVRNQEFQTAKRLKFSDGQTSAQDIGQGQGGANASGLGGSQGGGQASGMSRPYGSFVNVMVNPPPSQATVGPRFQKSVLPNRGAGILPNPQVWLPPSRFAKQS